MRARFASAAFLGWVTLSCAVQAEDRFSGIGIQAAVRHQALTVIHVIPNSPASKAGLSEGLLIQKIDDAETAGKSLKECVDLMRGKVGTKVKLELVDTNRHRTNNVVLTRAEVRPNVPASAVPSQ